MLKAFLLVIFLAAGSVAAGPKVTLVVSAQAPELEKFAAAELSSQLKALFAAEVTKAATPPAEDAQVVLVGSPTTNPAITAAWWPKLTDQGQVIRTIQLGKRTALVIGGGSPRATLWAVYEYGYRQGMRYLLNGDAPPIEKPEFRINGYDLVLEPNLRVRAWSAFRGSALGAESWPLADHERLLGQLAKNKFTHYHLPPEIKTFEPIRVDGDSGGRTAFKGVKIFDNPPVAGMREAIQKSAEKLGLSTAAPEDVGLVVLGTPAISALPEFSLQQLPEQLHTIRQAGRSGFFAHVVMPGDLNASVHFVSRSSFASELSPYKAFADLVTPICGEGVAVRLLMGFEKVEKAARLITRNDDLIGVPNAEKLLANLASKEPPPAWWAEVKTCYTEAMNEMYRGNTRARGGARPFILYHAKRLEFGVHYFTALDALRRAGNAKAQKDADAQAAALEQAVEALYNGLNALAEVARDPSDRAAIALLNAQGYHPLLKLLEAGGE